jgi:hypothetical protein
MAVFVGVFAITAAGCDDAPAFIPLDGSGAAVASASASATGSGGEAAGGQAGNSGTGGSYGPFMMTDSLKGSTMGNAIGGSLGPDGWTVTAPTDVLWYAIPRLVEGSIQFTMSNVTIANLVVNDNEVFALYEAGHGIAEPINYNPEFRENHYKSMIRIYGQAEVDRVGQQKIMWGMCPSGAPGYGACGCASFFEEPFGGDPNWDGSPQTLRVEWRDGVTRYYRNGNEVLAVDWSASGIAFGPNELHFSLGSSRAAAVGTAAMPVGAVFSDVVVEGVTGPESSCGG